MSRPSSVTSMSSKSSSQKGKDKVKDKGPSKDDIMKANEELSVEIAKLTAENQQLKASFGTVLDRLIENAKMRDVTIPHDVENAHLTDIHLDTLGGFIESLTAEAPQGNSMENRVEELETRITHLNGELAKLLRIRMTVENGLDEILNDCDSVEKVKVKARDLLREISKYDILLTL